jgi:FkbM family methyltransferase
MRREKYRMRCESLKSRDTMANLSGISNETFIGKMLRAPLRLIPRRMVLPILQGALRGKKWTAGSAAHGCWLGSYEFHKQKALQRQLKVGQVVYDIGANVGFYSLLASVLVGEAGHIYSFEPFPDNLRELRRHLVMNRVANCTVVDAAVSAVDGEASFDPSHDRCMGHLSAAGILRVRTLTLDRFIQEKGIRPPNLMKIDIEGAEYECLRGAAGVIHEFAPVIFLATHGREAHTACLDLLTKWRYRFESLDDRPPSASDELMAFPAMIA